MSNQLQNSTPPAQPGLYWADVVSNGSSYELIVEVYGTSPYLKMRMFNTREWCEQPIEPAKWGPKIERPTA